MKSAWRLALAGPMAACIVCSAAAAAPLHEFRLRGGTFFGPGPIEPDASLPDGRITHVTFDARALKGSVEFANDGSSRERFSDNRTRINRNIDAGLITLGDQKTTVRLAAVAGGPNHGRELYSFDEHGDFVWRVDLALDPGFEQGIIRMNDFVLSTSIVRVAESLQTQSHTPGGYDRAGSLPSGTYLGGRVGDFDDDGYLDGILVAAPNVPMGSDMLPGAPVALRRGFTSDVKVPAGLAAELALSGIVKWREPLRELSERSDARGYRAALGDVRARLLAARRNMERALLVGSWKSESVRRNGFDLTWRLDALGMLARIAEAQLKRDGQGPARIPSGATDATRRLFVDLGLLLPRVTELNRRIGDRLPKEARPQAREASNGGPGTVELDEGGAR